MNSKSENSEVVPMTSIAIAMEKAERVSVETKTVDMNGGAKKDSTITSGLPDMKKLAAVASSKLSEEEKKAAQERIRERREVALNGAHTKAELEESLKIIHSIDGWEEDISLAGQEKEVKMALKEFETIDSNLKEQIKFQEENEEIGFIQGEDGNRLVAIMKTHCERPVYLPVGGKRPTVPRFHAATKEEKESVKAVPDHKLPFGFVRCRNTVIVGNPDPITGEKPAGQRHREKMLREAANRVNKYERGGGKIIELRKRAERPLDDLVSKTPSEGIYCLYLPEMEVKDKETGKPRTISAKAMLVRCRNRNRNKPERGTFFVLELLDVAGGLNFFSDKAGNWIPLETAIWWNSKKYTEKKDKTRQEEIIDKLPDDEIKEFYGVFAPFASRCLMRLAHKIRFGDQDGDGKGKDAEAAIEAMVMPGQEASA